MFVTLDIRYVQIISVILDEVTNLDRLLKYFVKQSSLFTKSQITDAK